MALEIERKFLVANETWRHGCVRSQHLRDGLIAVSDQRKVRVRLYDDHATLTIKSVEDGPSRCEFEYEIPAADAEELLRNHCGEYVLAKTRHYVPYKGFTWEVDVYEGLLNGIIIAEVELDRIDAALPLPSWIGREVTGDPHFRKINMLKRALARRDALATVA